MAKPHYKLLDIYTRAFTSTLERVSVLVDPDGYILVYDAVIGEYTVCDSLSAETVANIRRLASMA